MFKRFLIEPLFIYPRYLFKVISIQKNELKDLFFVRGNSSSSFAYFLVINNVIIIIMSNPKSQIETDQNITNFLGDTMITTPKDLVILKYKIWHYLKFRPYNITTKKDADNLQWKRTAAEIIKDKYVYCGKACSDLAIVFLALCKAVGIKGRLVKLKSIDNSNLTHSIVEINLKGSWYRIDPSNKDSTPFKGGLTRKSIWNKKYKVWKKGRDVWDLGLNDIKSENKII